MGHLYKKTLYLINNYPFMLIDAFKSASINIRTAGLAGFACGETSLDVSMKQELETTLKV